MVATPLEARPPMPVGGLTVRPIEAGDVDALRRLFFRLSATTVYRRFFGPVKRPREAVLHHFAEVDHDRRQAFVAESDGEIIAVARYDRSPDDPGRAEIALLVQDDWQGRGVGPWLLDTLARDAERRGVEVLTASVLGDNQRMLGVARAVFPGAHTTAAGGEWSVEMPLLSEGRISPV